MLPPELLRKLKTADGLLKSYTNYASMVGDRICAHLKENHGWSCTHRLGDQEAGSDQITIFVDEGACCFDHMMDVEGSIRTDMDGMSVHIYLSASNDILSRACDR